MAGSTETEQTEFVTDYPKLARAMDLAGETGHLVLRDGTARGLLDVSAVLADQQVAMPGKLFAEGERVALWVVSTRRSRPVDTKRWTVRYTVTRFTPGRVSRAWISETLSGDSAAPTASRMARRGPVSRRPRRANNCGRMARSVVIFICNSFAIRNSGRVDRRQAFS